jgi:NSS family neurotransmitter:Na+ symporter
VTVTPSSRGQWSSQLGFILAAAGSAVGLGNIWRFPYMAGKNGGGAFVLVYLACVLVLGLPVMLVEISLGRATQRNAVGAIEAVAPRSPWKGLGYLALVTGLGILSYYSVIAGRVLGCCVDYVLSGFAPATDISHYGLGSDVTYFAIFLGLTVFVVAGGVQRGIERWAKVLMPLLLVIMMAIIVRGILLPGASAGLHWLIKVDFSRIGLSTVLDAMAQAFFSLSLGMGAMLTYGSYLSKRQDILRCGAWVVTFDTAVAILAGFMIFPAVFAFGKDPAAGPTLIFGVLPEVFGAMVGGGVVGAVFFFLLCVAALTSTVSLLEVVTAYFVDERGWSRRRSVLTIGAVTFLVGLPSAMDFAGLPPWNHIRALGQTGFLSIMDFLWGNLSLAVGSLLLCLFAAWVWGLDAAVAEISSSSPIFPALAPLWKLAVRWVAPLCILAILLTLVL